MQPNHEVVTVICSIAEHAYLRSLITEEHCDKLLRFLKDNAPQTRLAAARIVKVLIKYSDTRQLLLKGRSQGFWVERLHDSNSTVLEHVTSTFCYLVVEGYIHQGILPTILDALNSLEDSDANVSKRGATIIFGMASYARFRDILYEVLSIRAPIRHFMTDLSPKDADLFLQKMEYYGLLKEL
ncbi:hypothetical protein CPB86DRAFT_192089 [Serendipita vermifera]|nr:hypothetical protein CPB86DRAFT_192089 [Serendipita vermifera]